jgi:hypothetical protein
MPSSPHQNLAGRFVARDHHGGSNGRLAEREAATRILHPRRGGGGGPTRAAHIAVPRRRRRRHRCRARGRDDSSPVRPRGADLRRQRHRAR